MFEGDEARTNINLQVSKTARLKCCYSSTTMNEPTSITQSPYVDSRMQLSGNAPMEDHNSCYSPVHAGNFRHSIM